MTNSNSKQVEPVLEAGTGGHIHRFNAVRVPSQFGHSYLRCAYCGLSKHLESHDALTCDICTSVSAVSAAPVVDAKAIAEEVTDRWFRNALPERARAQSTTRAMLRILIEDVITAASPDVQAGPATEQECLLCGHNYFLEGFGCCRKVMLDGLLCGCKCKSPADSPVQASVPAEGEEHAG